MSDCPGALAKLVLRKMHTKTNLMKLKFSARKAVHNCYQCWKFELKISSDSGDMDFSAIKPRWGGCPPLKWLLDSGRRRSPDLPKCESGLRFVDREKGFWRRWEVGFCQLHFVWTLLVEGRYIVVRHAETDHARGLEDFVLKTQKKRQRKKQREREKTTNERMRSN